MSDRVTTLSNRIFNFAALCSAFGVGLVLIAFAVAGEIDVAQFLRLSSTLHVTLRTETLVLFSDDRTIPYTGSGIISIGTQGRPNPWPRASRFRFVGVHYVRYVWKSGAALWVFQVTLFYPLFAFAMLPVAWALRQRTKVSRGFEVIHRLVPRIDS